MAHIIILDSIKPIIVIIVALGALGLSVSAHIINRLKVLVKPAAERTNAACDNEYFF